MKSRVDISIGLDLRTVESPVFDYSGRIGDGAVSVASADCD